MDSWKIHFNLYAFCLIFIAAVLKVFYGVPGYRELRRNRVGRARDIERKTKTGDLIEKEERKFYKLKVSSPSTSTYCTFHLTSPGKYSFKSLRIPHRDKRSIKILYAHCIFCDATFRVSCTNEN